MRLANIGGSAKRSVAWSILSKVALECHVPIDSLTAHSWSRTSDITSRQKSQNNSIIVLLERGLNIRL